MHFAKAARSGTVDDDAHGCRGAILQVRAGPAGFPTRSQSSMLAGSGTVCKDRVLRCLYELGFTLKLGFPVFDVDTRVQKEGACRCRGRGSEGAGGGRAPISAMGAVWAEEQLDSPTRMESDMSDLGTRPTLEVTPKVGVPPVRFGMSQYDVKRVLGEASSEDPLCWYYFDNAFQITFDDRCTVQFIQLSWADAQFDVKYEGISVFHTPAEELVHIISGQPAETETDDFEDHELDLALWRPAVPSDYSPEDPDDEYRKGEYWMTIGVGDGHYFRTLKERR